MDREKVIKGLEVFSSIADGESCPKDCPYYQDVCYGYDQLMRDALALLKEQEEAHKILVEKADEMYAMLKEQGKSGCDGCIYKGSNDCQLDQTRDGNVVCPNGKLNIT